ncbi:LysR family transcriptional regulator [Pseudomonas wadenswilerensis]
MRYRRLDLNLLVALDVLLEECSVSRAAQRLNLGQSATSAALARLREHFADPLLVPVGRSLQPTALARRLAPKVREVLELAGELAETTTAFDPARCERRFTLVASDYVAATLIPAVSRALQRCAPGASLVVRELALARDGDQVAEALAYRRSDLAIVPQARVNPEYPQATLLEDELCCIVCAEHWPAEETLDLERYRQAEHVLREFADGQDLSLDARYLREIGLERRGVATVQSFSLMAGFVVDTLRIATLFRRQAEALAQRYPLRVLPAPVAFPRAAQVLQWHPQQAGDPVLAWFRQLLLEQAALLDQG